MEHEVFYYVIEGGDEWLEKEFNADDVVECSHYWSVCVRDHARLVEALECECSEKPIVGETVYCNGLGVVEILEIKE
jgi:hypothetical protein